MSTEEVTVRRRKNSLRRYEEDFLRTQTPKGTRPPLGETGQNRTAPEIKRSVHSGRL